MHATVTTWCLRNPPRDVAEFDRRVRTLMKGGIELGRQIGVVDVLIIEFDPPDQPGIRARIERIDDPA